MGNKIYNLINLANMTFWLWNCLNYYNIIVKKVGSSDIILGVEYLMASKLLSNQDTV